MNKLRLFNWKLVVREDITPDDYFTKFTRLSLNCIILPVLDEAKQALKLRDNEKYLIVCWGIKNGATKLKSSIFNPRLFYSTEDSEFVGYSDLQTDDVDFSIDEFSSEQSIEEENKDITLEYFTSDVVCDFSYIRKTLTSSFTSRRVRCYIFNTISNTERDYTFEEFGLENILYIYYRLLRVNTWQDWYQSEKILMYTKEEAIQYRKRDLEKEREYIIKLSKILGVNSDNKVLKDILENQKKLPTELIKLNPINI